MMTGVPGIDRDLPGRRQAVEPRHLDVQKDGVREGPPTHLDRAMAVTDDGHHVVAQRFQLILQSDRDWFLVVRDQNTIRPSHRRIPSGHNQGDEDLNHANRMPLLEISKPLRESRRKKHRPANTITADDQASV